MCFELFSPQNCRCICNASGSGKTRRILEGLTKYWGFYLVAIPDVNGVGIRDLQDAFEDIADHREWTSDLRPLPSEKRVPQNDLNSLIASQHLRKILAARIVIFQLFLHLAIVVGGKLQEKHKRIWLLFQLSDQLPGGGILHPFVQIITNEALVTLFERLTGIREKYLPQSHFIVVLDEAQRATRLYPYSFLSSSSHGIFRSIIREIVKVFTQPRMTLVVRYGPASGRPRGSYGLRSVKTCGGYAVPPAWHVRHLAETEAISRTLHPCFHFGNPFWVSPASTDSAIPSGSVS